MSIESVETISDPTGPSPALTFVRVTDSSGVVGLGETYYTPRSVAAYVHEILAPTLLGRSALDDGDEFWMQSYLASARRVVGGVDLRSLSAIDLALWDLRGRMLGAPVYQLLGGRRSTGVTVYNTCAGAHYASAVTVGRGASSETDDLWRAVNRPGELAAELLAAGYTGMKLWPFDAYADVDDGRSIRPADLRAGRAVLAAIRDAVGDEMQIMLEGHGRWHAEPAVQILRAVEDLDIRWAEDIVPAHDLDVLRRIADRTSVPLAASEYLAGRWEYRRLLESGAVGYLHLDPSWCGGISEARHILALATARGVVASMHDCTGPMNLLAGLHLAAADPIVGYQEVLRSFLDEVYPSMVDLRLAPVGGRLAPPDRPGLGAELTADFLSRPGLVRETTTR
jgi:L-alanine-DL-glutamate epimerase-like enolase superfamily enzyme